MFFAGDQIYEGYGGFGVIRLPVDRAMLDYLRKWYQFGWTWRHLLKDRPSVILPDDHDVFQANLWGAGGRATLRPEAGGYTMAPAWVKAVERSQTAHLPDAVDPSPVAQGIGVHFTTLHWGGVPMLILEDRKWKTGPDSILSPTRREQLSPEEVDAEGAQLLGERQERFLMAWAKTTQHAPLRMVLSQSIFCKAHTHSGPTH
jgi:alkaline phosphatase D